MRFFQIDPRKASLLPYLSASSLPGHQPCPATLQPHPRLHVAAGAVLEPWRACARADQPPGIRRLGAIVAGMLGTDEPNRPKSRQVSVCEIDVAQDMGKKIGVKTVFFKDQDQVPERTAPDQLLKGPPHPHAPQVLAHICAPFARPV